MDEMLTQLAEAAIDAVAKNTSKAADALTTGYIDQSKAEKKAISDSKIAVTHTATQLLTDKMKEIDVPEEFAKHALYAELETIVNKRSILNKIFGRAKVIVDTTPQDENQADQHIGEISDDWLNRFRDSACEKSSEEAQELFAKVLAGEIRKPGSFTLKALSTLADMNQEVAQLFNKFCSLCLVYLNNPSRYHRTQSKSHFKIIDARIPLLLSDTNELSSIRTVPINTETNTYTLSNFATVFESIYNKFGLRFNELQLLLEYSLIESSSSSKYNCFYYNNELWGYTKQDSAFKQPQDYSENITISGYALTSVGKELFNITERHTLPNYWALLSDCLENYYKIKLFKYPKSQKASPTDASADPNPINS